MDVASVYADCTDWPCGAEEFAGAAADADFFVHHRDAYVASLRVDHLDGSGGAAPRAVALVRPRSSAARECGGSRCSCPARSSPAPAGSSLPTPAGWNCAGTRHCQPPRRTAPPRRAPQQYKASSKACVSSLTSRSNCVRGLPASLSPALRTLIILCRKRFWDGIFSDFLRK